MFFFSMFFFLVVFFLKAIFSVVFVPFVFSCTHSSRVCFSLAFVKGFLVVFPHFLDSSVSCGALLLSTVFSMILGLGCHVHKDVCLDQKHGNFQKTWIRIIMSHPCRHRSHLVRAHSKWLPQA